MLIKTSAWALLVIALLAMGMGVESPSLLAFAKDALLSQPASDNTASNGFFMIGAESALLMDAETGTVLWEQNGYLRRSMASTTKIMSAMVLMEKGKLTDRVAVSQRAVDTEYAYLLEAGEHLTLLELLQAMLICSANDAAVAAAEHVYGSEAKCVARMNHKARQLGARDTHFMNVHGLYDPDHYTTAHDLALIAREAMKRPLFRELVSTKATKIPWEGHPGGRVIENRNHLLKSDLGVDGIKTGFVNDSGHCLVFSVNRGGCHLIGVLLKSPNIWQDARTMIWQAFQDFQPQIFAAPGAPVRRPEVGGGTVDRVPVYTKARLAAFVPTRGRNPYQFHCQIDSLSAPLSKGEYAGRARLYLNGKVIRSLPLYIARPVGRTSWATLYFIIRTVFLLFLLGVIAAYACRAFAKASLRRRRRLAAQVRGADPYRASLSQRQRRYGTGNQG